MTLPKADKDEKMVKGTVRRKIQILPNMMELFKAGVETRLQLLMGCVR